MKILLTGTDGQVGYKLWRTLQHLGDVIPTSRNGKEIGGMPTVALDLANAVDIEKKINAIGPDLICNAAAYTEVDNAENNQGIAHAINADAPAIFAKYAVISDTMLVHYSTDYVFSGDASTPWKESDACNPQGVYGETKLLGEQAIIDSGCQHMIFRTAWVFSDRGHNFIKSMLRLAQEKDELNIVDDQLGSPSWANAIALATAMTLKNPTSGLYHMTSSGKTTWCGFARRILHQAHKLELIPQIPKLNAISTSQYPTLAKRPAYSVLDCTKLKNTFEINMPNWQTSLQLCMQNIRRQT
ncbi:dTDP-4-dehydrorhamnose reductase [hydrothermal vent metagenome]|uniref:dTDP-4-dehydrorhamnose reductase n=1 Tax=hydrothermal vent metagenome TaxID=652676 RepID=A0A3B0V2A9_9ZZZZ